MILQLRLLIARSANKDSLAWWDDESLTPEGGFLLERLFPMAPPQAARSLALKAAWTRHEAACAPYRNALHLYRLDRDGLDRLALRDVPVLSIPVPAEPIPTIEALRLRLLDLIGGPMQLKVDRRSGSPEMAVSLPPCPAGSSMLVHRAKGLAWAYLEGGAGQPVFPYIQETHDR